MESTQLGRTSGPDLEEQVRDGGGPGASGVEKLGLQTDCPPFGKTTNPGRGKRTNEDALATCRMLLPVPCGTDFVNIGQVGESSQEGGGQCFDAFYVGDGHNGRDAAHFCAKALLPNIKAVFSELNEQHEKRRLENNSNVRNNYWSDDDNNFEASVAGSPRDPCTIESGTNSASSSLPNAANVLREAFRRTDSQFAEYPQAKVVGTTAVVALVGPHHLCVGSCGDSRAVLFREGEPVVLNTEHKVDLPQEKARILNAGGTISDSRVMGVLNMSRAIGDLCLRPWGVIPDPDVLTLRRSNRDEFLVIATDGLWDVMDNEEVYIVLRHAMERAAKMQMAKEKALGNAAKSLCRTAMDRGSWDNITVLVIDLHRPYSSSEGY